MEAIKERKLYTIALISSLLFFAVKGVRYALIGSYVPLLFILLLALCLSTYFLKDKRFFKVAIVSWSIILILWSCARLIMPILMDLAPGVTEAHIRGQSSIVEIMVSIWLLASGVFFWRKRKLVGSEPVLPVG